MPTALKITWMAADTPVTDDITKFGGQPHWLKAPQWPLSKTTGNPMRFIGQIALEPPAFQDHPGKIAYIFITDESPAYVSGTWDPEGGENAIIIQPNGNYIGRTTNISTGPTLYQMVEQPDTDPPQPYSGPTEFPAILTPAQEPAFVAEHERTDWSQQKYEDYVLALEGNKVGGTPCFLQGDEFPRGKNWHLLLQLDSTKVPFHVNFGDAGVAYAFINADATQGKLLWQGC